MDMSLFKSIIDQAVELGMESLDACGFGDPFMDPEFKEKLAYVKTKYSCIKVYTSATGHLLTSERRAWIGQYIDTLKISHYGFTKEVFEKVHRGSLQFEKVIKNIESLFAIPKENRPYIIMLFLVFPENEHQIEEWKHYWKSKADEVIVWLPHNYGGGHYTEPLEKVKMRDSNPRSCGRPFKGNLFVRENGEVSMCCFDFNRQLIIGDLRQHTLRKILEGNLLRKIREVHRAKTFSESEYICRHCDQIYSREGALLYATNEIREVGILTSHADLVNDMLK